MNDGNELIMFVQFKTKIIEMILLKHDLYTVNAR